MYFGFDFTFTLLHLNYSPLLTATRNIYTNISTCERVLNVTVVLALLFSIWYVFKFYIPGILMCKWKSIKALFQNLFFERSALKLSLTSNLVDPFYEQIKKRSKNKYPHSFILKKVLDLSEIIVWSIWLYSCIFS